MPSLPIIRSESKVAPANRHFFVGQVVGPAHVPIAAAVRAVYPVVESPKQSVHAQLLVALGETREDDATFVRATVAVGVLEKQNVWRRGDEQATVPWHHAVGERDFVGEDGRMPVAAVAIAVLEHPDAT